MRHTLVDEEHVKQQLRQLQQAWEAEQAAAGQDAATLQFWSVGKLLRVLQDARAATEPLQALAQCGITRHSVGSADHRRVTSQPTAVETQTSTADAVTYTSSHVWLTGFLHFGEELGGCDTLHLCDSNVKLPSLLLDPSPRLVDQLLLVKRWVLVDKAVGGLRTAGAMFLEVHEHNPVSLVPRSDLFVNWTQEEVVGLLEENYPTQDPPMYTGADPWAMVAARSKGHGVSDMVQLRMEGEGHGSVTLKKSKKRKRVHAVFGRVSTVSPISRQKDRASSHFFVEIESHRSCNDSATQSVANVMFTGVYNMQWHLFLRPGKIVLLTDLVKVLSRECEMFLLQATYRDQKGNTVDPGKEALRTSVLVWTEPLSPQKCITQWINDSLEVYSKSFVSRCCGKLLDYEGQVCRLLWDECVELQGSDGTRIIICLFHFPYERELVRLRKGTTVRVCGAHVIHWPTPSGGRLALGLCPRSHFAIISYSDPSSPCVATGTRSRRDRAYKKWSCLGDFHRQSMVLSMWLLEVLELLDAKFFFGEDEQVRFKPFLLSFPRTRRRQAAAHVAAQLHFSLCDGQGQASMTLGAMFLKYHSAGADNCATVQLPRSEKLLTCSRLVTIRELQKFGESKLREKLAARSDVVKEHLSVKISADDLDWCLLVGCIRGNVDSGDLEIVDRTGSMALHLNGAGTEFHDGDRGVYLARSFHFTVEDYSRAQELNPEEKVPLVYCINCSAANLEFISMRDDEGVSYSQEEKAAADAREVQEVLFMTTHVDALPPSSIRTAGLLPEYRVVHGIVCPVGEHLQAESFVKSACAAEVLISTQCTSWHIQKGGCYRIKAVEDRKDTSARSSSHHSVEDRAVEVSTEYFRAMKFGDESNVMCFDTLDHFNGRVDGESKEERSFRIFRVESGPGSFVPIKLECVNFEKTRCRTHALCQQSDRNESGFLVAPAKNNLLPGTFDAAQFVKQTPTKVSISEIVAMSIIRHFLQQCNEVSPVCSLLYYPLTNQSQPSVDDGANDEEPLVVMKVNPDLHKPHFVSVIGIITNKRYYWQSMSHQQSIGQTAVVGSKRARGSDLSGPSTGDCLSRRLACLLHVRDLQQLDTVEIRVDASRFGLLGTLQLNSVVEFSRLQGFITRSGYKVFLSWSRFTAARPNCDRFWLSLPLDAKLYGSMSTTFLNDLYRASSIDRMVHRYVVGVMHVSYVLLKRKCGLCHQALQLNRRRSCWKHADPQAESKYSRDCAWRWQQLSPSDPAFRTRTYLGTTVRCVIDDGSAQAELFLENDVAWELLTCTDGQCRRFEDILGNYIDELSYFSGHTANGSFATSRAEREQEYYQNELRAFVVGAIPSLRSVVVFARRFYKAKDKEGTSVLSFGKDIHLTTKTVPQPKLEAKRVDRVHVRSELQRRLTQLRLCVAKQPQTE